MHELLTPKGLDEEIVDVETWAVKAASSLLSLYDPEKSKFRRDTRYRDHVDEDPMLFTGRVSTSLAVAALTEYLRFLDEDPESFGGHTTTSISQIMSAESTEASHLPTLLNVRTAVETSIQTMQDWVEAEWLAVHPSPQYLHAVAGLALHAAAAYSHRLARVATSEVMHESSSSHAARAAQLEVYASALSAKLLTSLRPVGSAVTGEDEEVQSHMVIFHAARAQDVANAWNARRADGLNGTVALWDLVADPIRSHLLSQLGYYDAGIGSRFRVGDLVFSAALLDRLETGNVRQLVARAVEIVRKEQQSDGSWNSLPVISRRDEILEVSSYDIGYSLSCLLLNQFKRREWSLAEDGLTSLKQTFALVQTMRETVRRDGRATSGWAGEVRRFEQVVTGWGTARVLSFLLRYREALLMFRQHLVLTRYDIRHARPLDGPAWYDLIPISTDGARVSSSEKAIARLGRISDPHHNQPLAKALGDKLVLPILKSHVERPRNASFLLSGPPGTRKTSLLQAIAESLNWPILVLSPPDFLREGGIAGLQVVASEVFNDLLRLRRVVVLFDECEELFRRRDISGAAGADKRAAASARTDSAFLTAAMLPRLQSLRDRRWTVFALATNALDVREMLDEAVVREGRFDFALKMPHPSEDAQVAYIRREVRHELRPGKLPPVDIDDDQVEQLIERAANIIVATLDTLSPDKRKRVPWALLDLLVRRTGRIILNAGAPDGEIQVTLHDALLESLEDGPRDIFNLSVT